MKKIEKIGYQSNFNFECNTERGSIESLSIALGFQILEYETEQPILQLSTFFAIALASDLDVTLQKPQPNLFSKKKTTIMTIKNKNEGKYYL